MSELRKLIAVIKLSWLAFKLATMGNLERSLYLKQFRINIASDDRLNQKQKDALFKWTYEVEEKLNK